MAALTVEGISKRFGGVEALRDVNLRVNDGEFCVLLGPSGCGKSTLLNIVAGLIAQDRGSILFDGKAVDRLAPRERDVAMVFQSYALYPHMTVAQNLAFGLRMRRVPKQTIQASILDVARLLGIENLLERKPRELSGGQRQRVAMGRAIVRRPNLFLLDEPLSNLDARLRAIVRLELKRIHQQIKGTVVYVTHDQVEAMTLGDKVVVMGEGRIHQIDEPDGIYSRPLDTFVATFIGTPEMNLYPGRVVSKDGLPRFEGRGFGVDLGRAPVEEGEVELGFRPEDVNIFPKGETPLQAEVELIANVGTEKHVHARLGEETLSVTAPKEALLEPGELVSLKVEPSNLHLFRKGRRIEVEF